jgi:oligopeptide/dipeptide ABC transporter ATP-binding protein
MNTQINLSKDVPILKLEGLCKKFTIGRFPGKSFCALDNVEMDVGAGEIRGIVGESGAGKTTLARCSLRLIEPSNGSVWFDGQNLMGLSAAQLRARRKDFQMVFQDAYASLNPAMTVQQILLEPLEVHHVGDRESRHQLMFELLEAVSLSKSLISRKAAELSGGQQQRVGIARGLILKPRLVIADEPMSALDASVQAQMLNLLADLKKQYALTLILISHSLCAIHYLCTHISVLYRGRLVEEAPAEFFFGGPKHPYSRTLLDATPVLGALKPLHSHPAKLNYSSPPNTQMGCAFYPCCSHRFAVCAREAPPLKEVKNGERVACFLYHQPSEKQSIP